MEKLLEDKFLRLKEIFRCMGKVVVAFSGGVDSTFLLKVAKETLGESNVLAVTALSPLYPERERTEAKRGEMGDLAQQEGIPFIVEGSILDDDKDHRPGRKAIQELGIRSPLKEASFMKEEVRELSKALGLSTWDKASFACLASRFPYGEEITLEALRMVDEAEAFLFSLGFKQVRVRHYQNLARIEVYPEEISRLMNGFLREKVVSRLKEIGYQYVTLDLQGFRSGSMNEVL